MTARPSRLLLDIPTQGINAITSLTDRIDLPCTARVSLLPTTLPIRDSTALDLNHHRPAIRHQHQQIDLHLTVLDVDEPNTVQQHIAVAQLMLQRPPPLWLFLVTCQLLLPRRLQSHPRN